MGSVQMTPDWDRLLLDLTASEKISLLSGMDLSLLLLPVFLDPWS